MLDIFQKWYRRYLFEEESVLLLVLLTIGIVLLMTIGDIIAPVLAAIWIRVVSTARRHMRRKLRSDSSMPMK